jgi:DHA1 family inner membrane transport protein
MRFPPALWALAFGAFAIGMTEFTAIGLLNQVAASFGVSISLAGWVVTAYAGGVMIGAPLLTWIGLKIPRKTTLCLLMVLFAVGNAITAAAPWFWLVLAGRVLTSFAHGVFFGMGSVVGAEIVGPRQRAGAVAFMFSGLTVANLVGVPLGTWLGEAVSWRLTYALIALIGAGVALAIRFWVPALKETKKTGMAREVRAAANPQVIIALLMTLFGFGGVFAAITYLAPILTNVTHLAGSTVSWYMVVLGLGMVTGNWLGGRLADRNLVVTLAGSLGLLAAMLVAFSFGMGNAIAAGVLLFLIGAFGFATIPPLQAVTMEVAGDAPNLASVLNIGAFNLGNAVAAWLGGLALDSQLGFAGAPLMGAAMTVFAMMLAFVLGILRRRSAARLCQAA